MAVERTGPAKPLGIKAYGHIPHLPGSRVGPGDHRVSPGQARICTEKVRDRHDTVIVQEKLDGSCVAVAKVGGEVVALIRAGYRAADSPWEQHHLFAEWVAERTALFEALLAEGERLVGEWLAQAHGTRYALRHEPFVAFDLMRGHERAAYQEFHRRVAGRLPIPHVIHIGGPLPIEEAMRALAHGGFHGALDPVEGAVWRVERHGKVGFLAKYVRPDKVDGCYLPELSGVEPVWNWRPYTRLVEAGIEALPPIGAHSRQPQA
jgi:hypothetical protein